MGNKRYNGFRMTTFPEDDEDPFENIKGLWAKKEQEIERAYKLGVLHGINAQSMAQVKDDVMEFDDYGWQLENND